MSQHLYAIHDEGGEHLMADKPGWIVITEAIGSDRHDQSGRDYRNLQGRGFGVIARLNNGYFPAGSIPAPAAYGDFAQRCANFVKATKGCDRYIIANEPNHLNEQIPGQPILPNMYADCFNQCYTAIKAVRPNAIVITAPVAPWDNTVKYPANANGDWIVYFVHMQMDIPRCDGVGMHTYTHGAGIHLITSEARMQSPFQHRRFEFRTYLDFLAAMPPDKKHLPVFITETDQNDPWADANTGWVQAAYNEINNHNQLKGTQKIMCLALYRWQGDKWEFATKNGVHQDLRAAVAKGYLSPRIDGAITVTNDVFLPSVPSNSATLLPKRDWDERLTQRGVTIDTPQVAPGKKFWRVVKAQWFDEQEAGGRRHIYVEAITPDGRLVANEPFDVRWPSGGATESTKAGRGFEAGNFAMSPSLREFSVAMGDGVPSETVRGIGMGADGNPGVHTSTLVTFQLTTMPQAQQPAPDPIIAPGPTPPQSATFYVAVRDGANLRAAPSVDAAKLTTAAYGQALTVISATPNRDWLQVAWDGQTGWVLAALLSVEPPPPAPAPGGPPPPVPPAPTGIIDPMTALAFLQVESANAAFRDGLLVIRFEVHVFKTELRNDALFDMHFKFTPRNYADQWWRPTPNADWINAHGPMSERHKLLAFARGLNDTAALRSTGMGSAQVMGANHQRIGYATPQAMFNAFRHARYGVNAQVLGFVNYVLSDPALVDALRRRDWREMARRYNGISQVDVYAPLLEKALAEIGREVGA